MTTKQYNKTERLAVECENFERRFKPTDYTDRYEWQDILDSYRRDRDGCVDTVEMKRFHKYLRLIIADAYRNDELCDKLLNELIEEERQALELEMTVAEALDKEIEINE